MEYPDRRLRPYCFTGAIFVLISHQGHRIPHSWHRRSQYKAFWKPKSQKRSSRKTDYANKSSFHRNRSRDAIKKRRRVCSPEGRAHGSSHAFCRDGCLDGNAGGRRHGICERAVGKRGVSGQRQQRNRANGGFGDSGRSWKRKLYEWQRFSGSATGSSGGFAGASCDAVRAGAGSRACARKDAVDR